FRLDGSGKSVFEERRGGPGDRAVGEGRTSYREGVRTSIPAGLGLQPRRPLQGCSRAIAARREVGRQRTGSLLSPGASVWWTRPPGGARAGARAVCTNYEEVQGGCRDATARAEFDRGDEVAGRCRQLASRRRTNGRSSRTSSVGRPAAISARELAVRS